MSFNAVELLEDKPITNIQLVIKYFRRNLVIILIFRGLQKPQMFQSFSHFIQQLSTFHVLLTLKILIVPLKSVFCPNLEKWSQFFLQNPFCTIPSANKYKTCNEQMKLIPQDVWWTDSSPHLFKCWNLLYDPSSMAVTTPVPVYVLWHVELIICFYTKRQRSFLL